MNYKLILFFFLVFGFVFSGAFPQTIEGTTLELVDYTGDVNSGEANYESLNKDKAASVSTLQITAQEWESTVQEMDQYGINKKTQNGVDYYYECAPYSEHYSGEGEGTICNIVFYYNGLACGVASFTEGGDSETLDLGILVGNEIVDLGSGFGGFNFDPTQICPCPAVLGLISLAFFGITKSE